MKNIIIVITALVFSIGFTGCMTERYVQKQKVISSQADTLTMMKKQEIISLSKSGISDSLIISMMDATNTWFKLSTQDVIDLKNAGVSEKVISAMMQQPAGASNQESGSSAMRYYAYPPYFWWYDGFYPYWYYPSFSVRIGHGFYHRGFGFRGRFR